MIEWFIGRYSIRERLVGIMGALCPHEHTWVHGHARDLEIGNYDDRCDISPRESTREFNDIRATALQNTCLAKCEVRVSTEVGRSRKRSEKGVIIIVYRCTIPSFLKLCGQRSDGCAAISFAPNPTSQVSKQLLKNIFDFDRVCFVLWKE